MDDTTDKSDSGVEWHLMTALMDEFPTASAEELDKVFRQRHADEWRPKWDANRSYILYSFQRAITERKSQSIQPKPAEWGMPEPFEVLLSPVPPFKEEFIPISIRPWVKDVSERMSVPLDFAGICALVTLAGVIGRRAFVYPKAKDKDWKESICLSGAVVASFGKTKTPTWKMFTNYIVEVDSDWRREHEKTTDKYLADVEKWETVQKDNKKAKDKVGAVIEIPQPVERPPCRRIMLNDATPEKMHDVMKDNPAGVFYYRDELSSWVVEMDKEGRESQRGLFLAAMNGNDAYSVDRIGREGGFAIMCASVFGGFQPDLLIDFLSDTRNVSDGMIPRFPLIVWPAGIDLPTVDRSTDESAKIRFRSIVRTLAAMTAESVSLHFSVEAQRMFNDWFEKLKLKINQEEHPGKQSHLSKYKGGLPKIAALFQMADVVGSGGVISGNHLIDLDHLNKAIDFLAYLESHMQRIYDSIRSPLQQTESLLSKRLKTGDLKDGFSARDVKRKHWSGLNDAGMIDDALQTLAEYGWVRELPAKSGPGRPTYRWEINPALKPNSALMKE